MKKEMKEDRREKKYNRDRESKEERKRENR